MQISILIFSPPRNFDLDAGSDHSAAVLMGDFRVLRVLTRGAESDAEPGINIPERRAESRVT